MRGYAIDDGASRAVGKAPCLNCQKRRLGCHSGCDEYISWERDRRAFRAEAVAWDKANHDADAVHKDGVTRALRRRGIKVKHKE